jgi:hypothetical protein
LQAGKIAAPHRDDAKEQFKDVQRLINENAEAAKEKNIFWLQ